MNSVTHRGHSYDLVPETFYHLPPHQWFSYLNDSANLGEGIVLSKSAFERVELPSTDTPYFLHQGGTWKERLWEEIRITGFCHLPARSRALFLFEDYATAKKVSDEWFKDEQRHILPVRVLSGPYALIHRADSEWLKTEERQWGSSARNYWIGDKTHHPVMEVVVQGWVYFPEWNAPPFYAMPEPRKIFQ